MFVWVNGTTTQITEDGGPGIFSGVPDWVYEEEIFNEPFALWFSPDRKRIAFLRFDDTGVPTYTIPSYMNNQPIAPAYLKALEFKYPKVSGANPTVQFHLLHLDSLRSHAIHIDAFPADDLIIGEIALVTDDHKSVVLRTFNRVQDQEKTVRVDTDSRKVTIIRQRDGADGWLDNSMSIMYIGPIDSPRVEADKKYFVDITDKSGWAHLHLFPVEGGGDIQLTSGEWEVESILSVDTSRGLVYYLSTQHHCTERHLYSVSYKTLEIIPLVDDTVAAYWSASFSTRSEYYLLSYNGPGIPYQEVYSVNGSKPLRTITDNAEIVHRIKEYKLPKISYFDLRIPSGELLSVMQRRPATSHPIRNIRYCSHLMVDQVTKRSPKNGNPLIGKHISFPIQN